MRFQANTQGALLLCVLLAVGACGSGSKEPVTSAHSALREPTAMKVVRPGNEEPPPGEEGPASESSETPGYRDVYFGQLKGPMLDRPPSVTPVEGGPVILVVVDALNARHVGAYGHIRDTTPAIDRVAKGGVTFTRWVASSSWTRPSFTTILTGNPKRIHKMEMGEGALDEGLPTLGTSFKEAGYRTAGFIGNPLIGRKWGHDRGFQVWMDAADHGGFPRAKVLVDAALVWLESVKDEPFFVLLFLTDPHAPYEPPDHARVFSGGGEAPELTAPRREVTAPLSEEDLGRMVAAYDDEVAYADSQLARVLEWVSDLDRPERVTIAITADHGEIFGEHDCFQHAYHMWEPVVRVPFIVRSGAMDGDGAYLDTPAGHEDVLPTLLHLVGLDVPDRTTGTSAFDPDLNRSRLVLTEYDARGVRRMAVRKGDLKLVRHWRVNRASFRSLGKSHLGEFPSLTLPGPRYEAFDLRVDPGEKENLFSALAGTERLEELRRYIKKIEIRGDPKPKVAPKIDPETLEALKAAGYIR